MLQGGQTIIVGGYLVGMLRRLILLGNQPEALQGKLLLALKSLGNFVTLSLGSLCTSKRSFLPTLKDQLNRAPMVK